MLTEEREFRFVPGPLSDIRNQELFIQEAAMWWAETHKRLPSRDEAWEMFRQYRYHDSDPIGGFENELFSMRVWSLLDAAKHGYVGVMK